MDSRSFQFGDVSGRNLYDNRGTNPWQSATRQLRGSWLKMVCITNSVTRTEDSSMPSPSISLERKPFRLHKWHIVTLVLALIVLFQFATYVNLNSKYDSLSSDLVSLRDQKSALESSNAALQSQFNTLGSQYDSLQTQYDELQKSHDSLQSSCNILSLNYTSLDAEYHSLKTQHDAFVSGYAELSYLINQRSQHLDISKFITPDDPSVKETVTQVTGGWSNPADLNEFWNDIKAMYNWVVNNIDYRYDGLYPVLQSSPTSTVSFVAEMWQFPNETLTERKGDCEDMAILLTSMIRYYGAEKYWTESIWIACSLNAHVAVQIPVSDNKITILDPAGKYYTSDTWGNLVQKDLSTEISNWLNYWKPSIGNDVYVYRLFANYVDKTFASTSEYVSWMYANR